MYKKLDELMRLNDAMNDIIADVERCNKRLEAEYKQHEKVRLDEFMDKMNELASYAKNLSYCHFCTDIVFKKAWRSDGIDTVLIFDCDKNGNFQILTNGGECVYASAFAAYGSLQCQFWTHNRCEDFEDGWGYDGDNSKKFIATHANEILDAVQKKIENRFEDEIKSKAEYEYKKQSQLLMDIERVKK